MFLVQLPARILLIPLVAVLLLAPITRMRAELSDEQKKSLFLKSSSGGDSPQPISSPHPKHSKHPSPTPTPHHSSHAHHKERDKELHGKKSAHPHVSPSAKTNPDSTDEPKAHHDQITVPAPHPATIIPQTAPPSPTTPSASSSLPLPHGATPSSPITIEKSGVETAEGLEPAPTPQVQEGFWSRVFGSHRTYNYLSASTRAAIDRAPVRRGRWKYIVVHNSGTREGNARVFNIYHFRVRHMKNGLAYHFVIGDGHGSGDGQIEIGHRWTAQLNGGHVASDYLNDIALGICLVGDFNRDQPTKAQVGALEELVAYLRERVGKSQGHRAIVYAHKEINPRPTDCPGDHFPYNWMHATFGNPR